MKYITHFATEAEYQTALPTLDLPNVSLVDELQEVHYHRALYGAHAGDIALYDVAEGQKIVVTAEDWNLTTYPTANYPIIGVVVADETPAGCRVISTFGMNVDGTNATSDVYISWGNIYLDYNLTKYGTADAAKTDFNGKSNTATILAAIKAYDLSHSEDNITGYVGQGIQLYSTEGTSPGDWYIPAAGELFTAYTNYSILNTTFNKIYNANRSLTFKPNFTSGTFLASTETNATQTYRLQIGTLYGTSKKEGQPIRPFTII